MKVHMGNDVWAVHAVFGGVVIVASKDEAEQIERSIRETNVIMMWLMPTIIMPIILWVVCIA